MNVALLLYILLSFLVLVLWMWALIDLVKSSKGSKEPMAIWALLILFLPLLGSILYFQIGRRRMRENKRTFDPAFNRR